MTPSLGEFALWAALPLSIWGCVIAFLGAKLRRGDLVRSAERSVLAVAALLAVAAAGLVGALLSDRFDYAQVFEVSSRNLDPLLKVAGLWSGARGALLFWTLALALCSALAVGFNRSRHRARRPEATGILLGLLSLSLILALFVSPTFERLPAMPADGSGMPPELRSLWAALHRPFLTLGFASLTVPFAFVAAALLEGDGTARRAPDLRGWTLSAWILLTVGILLELRWSYGEAGWNGPWSPDPGRIAALLAWLAAAVLLHALLLRRGTQETAEARGSGRWGATLAYLGLIAAGVGVVGSGFGTEVRQAVDPGETVTVPAPLGPAYRFTYHGLSSQEGRGMWQMIASFSVRRGDRDVGLLLTEQRLHHGYPQPIPRVGIRSFPTESLHVTLEGLDERVGLGNNPEFHGAIFRFRVQPFVPWIWYGGVLALLGAAVAARPTRAAASRFPPESA